MASQMLTCEPTCTHTNLITTSCMSVYLTNLIHFLIHFIMLQLNYIHLFIGGTDIQSPLMSEGAEISM